MCLLVLPLDAIGTLSLSKDVEYRSGFAHSSFCSFAGEQREECDISEFIPSVDLTENFKQERFITVIEHANTLALQVSRHKLRVCTLLTGMTGE